MKVVYVVNWFTESMGYSIGKIPKYAAKRNYSVFLISSEREVYGIKRFKAWYQQHLFDFLGEPKKNSLLKLKDGYILIRLRSYDLFNQIVLRGLRRTIRITNPDVVQSGELIGLTTLRLCQLKKNFGYSLFSECHIHASVFKDFAKKNSYVRLKWFLYRKFITRFFLSKIDYVFAISDDAKEIAIEFYGISKDKIRTVPMGIDNELIPSTEERLKIRQELRIKNGISEKALVCIYSGRIGPEKKIHVLVEAVELLRLSGTEVQLLLIGSGSKEYLSRLSKLGKFIQMEFMDHRNIFNYYIMSDLGVWPAQESISQLDALACGLPVILSNQVRTTERIIDDVLLYEEGDARDLMRIIDYLEKNRQRIKFFSRQALEIADSKLSWQHTLDEYTSIYIKTLTSRVN